MGSADYLYDVATILLASAGVGLDPSRTGGNLIDRQFVAHGEPVWELCAADQLTVHAALVRHDRQSGRQPCQVQPVVEWHVQVVRCVPGLDDSALPPTADALDQSAEALLVDLWCLLTQLYADTRAGMFGDCQSVAFRDATPLGPSGGVAGWDVIVEVACDDAGPPAGS